MQRKPVKTTPQTDGYIAQTIHIDKEKNPSSTQKWPADMQTKTQLDKIH
jgi:hypothetical protein